MKGCIIARCSFSINAVNETAELNHILGEIHTQPIETFAGIAIALLDVLACVDVFLENCLKNKEPFQILINYFNITRCIARRVHLKVPPNLVRSSTYTLNYTC